MQFIKNTIIFNLLFIFFSLTFLEKKIWSVYSFISLFLVIVYSKIISKKLFGLVNPTKAGVFNIHELIEIIIFDKYKNLIFLMLQIVAPSFQSFNNDQQLLVVSFILYFYSNYFFQKIDY